MVVKSTDLKRLQNLYDAEGNQLVLLYGKKDNEKELLIKEFLSDKDYFYYRARQASAADQRKMMGREMEKAFGLAFRQLAYQEYFSHLKNSRPGKYVLVIDQAQDILKKDQDFYEAVLSLYQKKLYPGPIMIVLASSSLVWSEQNLSAFPHKIKMEDYSFLDLVRAFPEFSVSDAVALYGVFGGVQGYLSCWNKRHTFKQNICELVLSDDGFMFDKAQQVISGELRELSVYNTILGCIASGKNKLNDLYLETGFSRAKISVYMKNLAQFDIVEKNISFETGGWENTKKGVYQIKDHFVNFWYRFVFPHLSDLYLLSPGEFYDKYIAKNLDEYLSRYFVEVCKEYLSLLNQMNRLPFEITKMGSWIGKEGNLDIIAQSDDRRSIVGMCNWEKPAMTVEMFDKLTESMGKAKVTSDHIFLFSARAFAPSLVDLAKTDSRLELIDMREL